METVPQVKILAHPQTKVFVSHCGANSAAESNYLFEFSCNFQGAYFGVPVLAVPYGADQPQNAAYLKASGMALVVNPDQISEELFGKTLTELLQGDYRCALFSAKIYLKGRKHEKYPR